MADDGTLPRVERRGRHRGRRRVLWHARWLVQGGRREDRQGPVAVQTWIGRGGETDHVHRPRRPAVRGRPFGDGPALGSSPRGTPGRWTRRRAVAAPCPSATPP